ncbi:MAG: T9SS type A sorting domain-containing protein [Bacteroidia bacterium]|nr:T9SS type A sorting domain-containing protein [Bacteroidia bacterium]
MKRLLLSILLMMSIGVHAQMLYRLDTSYSTYFELTGSTDVSSAAWDSSQMVTLPFAFKYFDKAYNNVYISYEGVHFSDTGNDNLYFGIDEFVPESNDITKSPISFRINGDVNNRIVIIEYKNVREANSELGMDYYLNVQIWLYETSNKIEIHFGPSSITDPQYTSFYIGLLDVDDNYSYGITGSKLEPILDVVDISFTPLPAYPDNNQVYNFYPTNWSSVNEKHKVPYTFGYYENSFIFQFEQSAQIQLMDISGKYIECYQYESLEGIKHFSPNLNAGVYIIEIRIGTQIFYEKISVI